MIENLGRARWPVDDNQKCETLDHKCEPRDTACKSRDTESETS